MIDCWNEVMKNGVTCYCGFDLGGSTVLSALLFSTVIGWRRWIS